MFKIYFKLRYLEKIGTYKVIAEQEGEEESSIRAKFSSISDYYSEKIGVEIGQIKKAEEHYREYTRLRGMYFSESRKELFELNYGESLLA